MNDLQGSGVPAVLIVKMCCQTTLSPKWGGRCSPTADSKWYALMVIQPKVSQVAYTAINQVADTVVSSGGRY